MTKIPKTRTLTKAERHKLATLERRLTEFLFSLHQVQLLTSALRREIRLARKALEEHGRFERIERIEMLTKTIQEWTHDLRVDGR